MRSCPTWAAAVAGAAVLAASAALPAGEKTGAGNQNQLVVIDANGKEHKVKDWKFTKGTKHLSWLAAAAPEDKGKKGPAGPEALEFAEGKLPPLSKGVLTYLPLSSVRSIQFDAGKDKDTM